MIFLLFLYFFSVFFFPLWNNFLNIYIFVFKHFPRGMNFRHFLYVFSLEWFSSYVLTIDFYFFPFFLPHSIYPFILYSPFYSEPIFPRNNNRHTLSYLNSHFFFLSLWRNTGIYQRSANNLENETVRSAVLSRIKPISEEALCWAGARNTWG